MIVPIHILISKDDLIDLSVASFYLSFYVENGKRFGKEIWLMCKHSSLVRCMNIDLTVGGLTLLAAEFSSSFLVVTSLL